jgi:hypothetical protein
LRGSSVTSSTNAPIAARHVARASGDGLEHDRGALGRELVEDRQQQRVEVGKALVEVARREPGPRAHAAHGRRLRALGPEQIEPRRDQRGAPARAALGRVEAAVAAGYRPGHSSILTARIVSDNAC